MKPRAAKARFLARLAAAGLSLETLTPAAGVEGMLAYYAEERADGCPIDADGDMLLFQWGTSEWGHGAAFEVNITRQLIAAQDEEPRQLGLTFRFEPSAGATARDGNRWCAAPDSLPEFRRFVTGSAALKAVGQRSPGSVELQFGRT